MKPLSDCRLYAFVDMAFLRGRSPEALAQQLCEGGADLIQLRAKDSTPNEVRRMAKDLLRVTRKSNVGLVINDHPAIACELGADFCHLGQEDFFGAGYERAQQVLAGNGSSPDARKAGLGLSTHAPAEAERAISAGADYIAIGPVYATGTKPEAKPVTLEYVRWAAAHVRTPWFVIGGINLGTLDAVLEAGARRICVVSAILNAEDVTAECRKFKTRLSS